MYKNFYLTESEKEQILKQHKSHGYKKPLNEQSYGDDEEMTDDSNLYPTYDGENNFIGMNEPSEMDVQTNPNEINLREQMLFIVKNLDGSHTEDRGVTQEKMAEVLKAMIMKYVNPKDTISVKEWNNIYYTITNDRYA